MNNKVKEITTSIGAIGEMTGLFYKTLTNSGVPKKYASELTRVFLTEIMEAISSKQ